MSPLQARITLRTLYADKVICSTEFDSLEDMLTSSDKENHVIAVEIIKAKKQKKINQQLDHITGSVSFDIMLVDPQYLVEISNMAPSADRDKLFAIYLNHIPMSNQEKEGLLDLLDSNDHQSSYLAEQIIIGKIRELQNSKHGNSHTVA
jgi:hypothetical protein